jgi:hypothetical protein
MTMLAAFAPPALFVTILGWIVAIAFGAAAAIYLVACSRYRKITRTTPPNGRRFQFSMTSLLGGMAVVAIIVSAVALLVRANARSPLEGSWHGYGLTADCSMTVHFNQITLVNHGQSQTFRCAFPKRLRFEEIDLYGPNGVQYGLFTWGSPRCELQLANPGEPRPQDFQRAGNARSQYFQFARDR